MVVAATLKNYLDEEKISYHVLTHHERFTSPEIAQALHVPGRELAKVVMIRTDEKLVMAVLPANLRVDFPAFARVVGAKTARLATEAEFQGTFPDCEVGSMPPFGNLYHVEVWVDRVLTYDRDIVFEAGSHKEAIKLAYQDFARLVRPKIADFSEG